MSAQASCPGCGAPVVFRISTSVVVVCQFCSQVVARAGADVEDLGKSNQILHVPSPLSLGTTGTFRGVAFTVVGRTQLQHSLGGTWNEWYASLDTGAWAWVAEHQGRLAFMAESPVERGPSLLAVDAATPGSRWPSASGTWTVNERGTAVVYAEEGELPWRAVPREQRAYVDLSGDNNAFASLDFGTVVDGAPQGPRRFYTGFEAAVDDLQLRSVSGGPGTGAFDGEAAIAGAPKVSAEKIACPNCGSPLTPPRADSLTVVCPSCGSGLSVENDKRLALLFPQKLRFEPFIPLERRATIDAKMLAGTMPHLRAPFECEVVAFVVRSVVEDGETFYFYETVLHSPKRGYMWLVYTDGEWWLFMPVPPAEISEDGARVRYRNHPYLRQSASTPKVEQVMGELYWRTKVGDTSRAADYARMSSKLSSERTDDEVNWTVGGRIPRQQLEAAFGVSLPTSSGLGGGGGGPGMAAIGTLFGGGGGSGGTPAANQIITILVVLFVLMFIMPAFCGVCGVVGGGGGGHSSYSGGGSYSFGK